MTLKDRIKELADQKNLSLQALELKLGFGNGTIAKWDKSTPNVDKFNQVAKFFHVTMDDLLNGPPREQQGPPNINDTIVESLADRLDFAPLEIHAAGKLYTCDSNFIRNININDKCYFQIDDYFRKKLNMPVLTFQKILNVERFITPNDLSNIITGLDISIEALLNLSIPPYTIAKYTFIRASFLKEGYFIYPPSTYKDAAKYDKCYILALNSNDIVDQSKINIDAYNAFTSRIDDFISSNIEQLISKSI